MRRRCAECGTNSRPAVLLATFSLESCQVALNRNLGEGDLRGSVVFLDPQGVPKPVVGALAQWEGATVAVRTDARGRFVLRGLPLPARMTLRVTADVDADGIVDAGLRLADVAFDAPRDLGTLPLQAVSTLDGIVRRDGVPVADARVLLDDRESAWTDADGRYKFVRQLPGDHVVVAVMTDPSLLASARAAVFAEPLVVTSTDLTLDHVPLEARVAGSVRLQGRTSHEGTSIRLAANEVPIAPFLSDTDGRFESGGRLPPGIYTVHAEAPDGFSDARQDAFLVDGETTPPLDLLVAVAPDPCDEAPIDCPSASDADGDGVPDSDDNCMTIPNLDQADLDGDQVGDLCDNCPTEPSLDQFDIDDDGLGNACDPVACKPDGVKQAFEDCDGTDFAGETCAEFGLLGGGDLSCNTSCAILTDGCLPGCDVLEDRGEFPCETLDSACTVGTCNRTTGACGSTNRIDGSSCDNGDACPGLDACVSGVCEGPACNVVVEPAASAGADWNDWYLTSDPSQACTVDAPWLG